ncbi:antigen 5 like allergen Cul n 1-like [Eupeodes corollae]|uniref:antigen 5 like allergen Cul n 1-like n=1 Tax=Eupeodes corollae TaxID=290404 RepID=UPI002492F978|nr:antigen 5 like allergen Cul n 1-like [Eupeodes corollae]
MVKHIVLSFLLFLNVIIVFGASVDKYCNRNLCGGTNAHVACNNNQQIQPSCAANSKVLKLSPQIKQMIVDKHNAYRNQLALGKVPHFPSANRMATMKWSDELEFMAKLNVKSCTGTHDSCRNTPKFKQSGQNIGRQTIFGDKISSADLESTIKGTIDRWFAEYPLCPRNQPEVYTDGKNKCGHFTVMIADKNTHVGCAMILMKNDKTVLTCNYATTNLVNSKLFHPGKTASQCKSGKSKKYSGLCSSNEKYF